MRKFKLLKQPHIIPGSPTLEADPSTASTFVSVSVHCHFISFFPQWTEVVIPEHAYRVMTVSKIAI